ncbi:MAG: hypothetical protein HEQ38_08695 [Gemmatimonas sp.]|nr:hypothetical protein [Gemmatimonas sp.]
MGQSTEVDEVESAVNETDGVDAGERGEAERGRKRNTIYVNAEPHLVSDKDISFEEVVALARGLPTGPNILYGVTYQRGHGNKPMGTLVAGQTTKVKNEMIFSVTATDRS